MRVESKHAHAYTEYNLISWKHYIKLFRSVVEHKLYGYKTLTVHLPFEIQHPQFYNSLEKGLRFIRFGEWLKRLFRLKLYWENAPWLNLRTWDLKYTNTSWEKIPKGIDLCLDTGHLMLGCKDRKEFTQELEAVLEKFGRQIKHLHLHENNLKNDKHRHTQKILTKQLVRRLTKQRSYIWEEGE